MSFLQLEGLHAFVTGAGGGIGSEIVRELLGKLAVHQGATASMMLIRASKWMQGHGARQTCYIAAAKCKPLHSAGRHLG